MNEKKMNENSIEIATTTDATVEIINLNPASSSGHYVKVKKGVNTKTVEGAELKARHHDTIVFNKEAVITPIVQTLYNGFLKEVYDSLD